MKTASKAKVQNKQDPKVRASRDWAVLLYKYRGIAVFVFSFLIYFNTIPNDYNLDDKLVTQNNEIAAQGISQDNIKKIFTQPYYQDKMGYSYGYRPLTTLSFAIEHSIVGDNPHAGHLINLLLYGLLCFALLKTMERMLIGYSKWLPLIATILFVCHPIHTEVVASIKNRDEILSFLFGTMVLYFLFSDRLPFWQRYILGILLFLAGTLSKPNLVLLPELIVLALLLFKKENIVKIIITALTLATISTYYMENVSDGFKALYVIATLIFSSTMAVFVNGWYSLNYIKSNILYTSFQKKTQEGEVKEKLKINLKGNVYIFFLFLNMALAIGGLYTSITFSSPWIMIIVAAIYNIELMFFEIDQLWLTFILFDLAVLFLLYGQVVGEFGILMKQTFFIFFIFFHISILVNIKKELYFRFASALLYVLAIVFVYFHPEISTLFAITIFFPAVTYIYRQRLFTSVFFIISLFILVCLHGGTTIFTIVDKGPQSYLFFNLSLFVFFLIGLGISLFKTAQNKLPGIMAFTQILFVCAVFILSLTFHIDSIGSFVKASSPIGKKIQTAQTAKQLPSITQTVSLNRPILFIEFPVNYPASANTLVATSAYQFWEYFMLQIKPWPMSFYSHTMREPGVIFSILVFLLLLVLALMFIRKNQAVSFSLFFMILSILPYLCVVSVIPGMIADRYSFQSSFGFSILLAMGFVYFYDLSEASAFSKYIYTPRLKQITKFTFIFVVSCYTSISFLRNGQWKDSVTLMRHDIQIVPQSVQAHNLLAHHLVERSFEVTDATEQKQMREESLMHFKRSVELYPTFFNTNYDLARNFALLNQADSAIFWFKKSINIDTTFMEAYLSVGELYFQTNQYEKAIPYFESVSRNQPQRYASYDRLGLIYMRQYKYDKAMSIYTNAIKNVPEVAGSYLNIGIIYSNTHKIDSARYWFQKALQVSPGNKDAEQLLQGLGKISQ